MIQLFDEPFFTFYEHELDGRGCVCLGDNCPLSEIGDKPKLVALTDVSGPPEIGPRPD